MLVPIYGHLCKRGKYLDVVFRSSAPRSVKSSRLLCAMSTFKLQEHDNIPVTVPDGLSRDMLTSHHPFKNWLKTLSNSLSLQTTNASHPFHSEPYSLRSIDIQSFDLFGRPPNQRLGFLKLKAEISNDAGETLPGSVFLRGPSVAMLVILVPEDDRGDRGAGAGGDGDGDRLVLLTVQPRVAAGSLALAELPAGMVDEEGNFVGTAANEIKEELGLDIPAGELVCLSEMAGQRQREGEGRERRKESSAGAAGGGGSSNEGDGNERSRPKEEGEGSTESGESLPMAVYPSPGGSDEYLHIYMHERQVPRAQLGEWTGRLTGLRDEGEKITLKLVPMRDLWHEGARDAKCLAALALYDGLRRVGKI